MNSVIKKIYQTKCVENEKGQPINVLSSCLQYDVGVSLYNLIRNTRGKNTLEVGFGYGVSTLFICQAHLDKGEGTHTSIDPLERRDYQSVGLLNLKRAGLEGFLRFFEAPSHDILPELLFKKERFDFIFIDGDHKFTSAFLDFVYADKLLNIGGHMMFDDVWLPPIRKVINFILKNDRNYELSSEFVWRKNPVWKRVLCALRNFMQTPFSPDAFILLKERLIDGIPNCCILKKISADSRNQIYYTPF